MVNHFVPFITSLTDLSKRGAFKNRIRTLLYSNEEQGHNPLPEKETISVIKNNLKLLK
ncbi:hypothetical protein AJ85_02105 [Alkalihalobacillus alcalophilus ATCC 27647 = CGMCC 1.3604]|uniref:Uncharacterized protein n=1 Tax=Alkalihalobacillus alcalophilus ATCC 27647 = CGMCC 1.3604 TaxID=1218173 RepID=A0A4S4JYC7_ALKAL|nr:hypothetical protein [Alkalihalobacillus alcalophilus]MED1562651.1 hypothetical protein [Alkalihalobacillus alcalophilus]THG88589.1 hypothetical protein AJ85_02105 [Alkalihalobacillus alcalophilus ATCC 27647 = CGMCC 1.3604]